MLALDCIFMFLSSYVICKNLLIFFNPNINQIPPGYKYQMAYKIMSSSVKIWHFYNILSLFVKTLF